MRQFAREVAAYLVVLIVAVCLAVLPHAVAYASAWGTVFYAGDGFDLALVREWFSWVAAAVLLALAWRRCRWWLATIGVRLVLVVAVWVVPSIVFDSFGGLARSMGRGLEDRVRWYAPVERLQAWAVGRLGTSGRASAELPPPVARALPPNPKFGIRGECMDIRWYDHGILAGGEACVPDGNPFFLARIKNGVYVYVVEK